MRLVVSYADIYTLWIELEEMKMFENFSLEACNPYRKISTNFGKMKKAVRNKFESKIHMMKTYWFATTII